jgi:UDP-galactopyranose mutase
MQVHFDEEFSDVYIESKDYPGGEKKMYPVHTDEAMRKFREYLKYAARQDKVVLLGRLGLFHYMNMDQAIGHVFEGLELIRNYKTMSAEKRMSAYEKLSSY